MERMFLLDPTGRSEQGTEATRSTCHPNYLAGHPDRVRPQPPLRRLTGTQDGTVHGAGDSLTDPAMAPMIDQPTRSVAFPVSLVVADARSTAVSESVQGGLGFVRPRRGWRVGEHS